LNTYLYTTPTFEKVFNEGSQAKEEEKKEELFNKLVREQEEEDVRRSGGKSREMIWLGGESEKSQSASMESGSLNMGCESEPYLLMFKRWRKLEKDFMKKDGTFDISKIPDICDNIKFDLLHNAQMLDEERKSLFAKVQLLSSIVVPLEYGIKKEDKLKIGFQIIHPLLRKIHHDLLWWTEPNASTAHSDFTDEN